MLRYAGVGVGGMLTFHVTCSRGGDVNVPCDLLTLLMLRHAGVGVGVDVDVPCDLLTLLMVRTLGMSVPG